MQMPGLFIPKDWFLRCHLNEASAGSPGVLVTALPPTKEIRERSAAAATAPPPKRALCQFKWGGRALLRTETGEAAATNGFDGWLQGGPLVSFQP